MPGRQARFIHLASRLTAATVLAAGLSSPSRAAGTFGPEAICRAAIATIAGRDPKAMHVTRITGDMLFLSYVRPIDNFVWDYRCRIEGNRVFWASEPGRWRDDEKDDKVFFEIVGDGTQLRISNDHSDGSTTKELFDRDRIF